MMIRTKFQGSMPCCFRQEDFSRFLYIDEVFAKHVTPAAGPFLASVAYFEQTW